MTGKGTINADRAVRQFPYQVAVDCFASVSMEFPDVRPREVCLFEYILSLLITLKMEAASSHEISVKTVPCHDKKHKNKDLALTI